MPGRLLRGLSGWKTNYRRSISPIIAILLLILITIAAGITVYAYVMGFVGDSQSTSHPSGTTVSIDDFCASVVMLCGSNGYSIVVRNVGETPISNGTIRLYFSDRTKGTSAAISCQLSLPVNPGGTFVCPSGSDNPLPVTLSATPGDTISLQLNVPDGSAVVSSAKIGAPSFYYVPIMLSNLQSTPTPVGFQQSIDVDFRAYQSFLAADVGNIRFFNSTNFTTQNELRAWLESYTGGNGSVRSANSSIVWINLGGTIIPASSQATIYMVFEPASTEFDDLYWGEAPTLSPAYAEYDNGVQVFTFYDNFAGNTISSGWNVVGASGTYSVNNGLTVNSSPFPGLSLSLNNEYTGPLVEDAFQSGTSGDWIGLSFSNEQSTSSSFAITSGAIDYVYPPEGEDGYHGLCTSSGCTNFTPNPASTTLQVVSLAMNSTTATEYQNYASPTAVSGTMALTNYPGMVQIAWSSSDTQTTYWFRLRCYPPDGVMPSVVFGPVS